MLDGLQDYSRLNVASMRKGLTEQVQEALIDMLLEGLIPDDAPIRIDALAEALNVSSTPVRESLARLEGLGLVVRENYRGYRTAPKLTKTELADLMSVRRLLEPEAAHLACERRTEELLGELEGAVKEQRASLTLEGTAETRAFMRADQKFHRVIHAGSGNRFLASTADVLGGNVQRWRHFKDRIVTDAADSLAEHEAILRCFVDGDPQGARQAMCDHIDQLLVRMEDEDE
ncbi:GntR family transcriptional regulator [Schaalia sp. 19OD2882]|uniref:GntR family transcriptional regulator n=1 Tax=Schaalia sp. 19OD2882 TaxID=2794089 RepID=UPI001C1ED6F3|nr:GntR family transcriptional regulator [Schaalia sp. 19OD2882]QWW19660.1 GntR family transcriptional regulator [Schaalia sp. 19OD2882]